MRVTMPNMRNIIHAIKVWASDVIIEKLTVAAQDMQWLVISNYQICAHIFFPQRKNLFSIASWTPLPTLAVALGFLAILLRLVVLQGWNASNYIGIGTDAQPN